MSQKIRNMVGIAMFTAIVVVLQLLGGAIKFGLFSVTVVLVPIVVGAALYGWKAGGWLGFAFGVTVLLTGDAASFMTVNWWATILVVLAKGTACGMVAGLLYQLLRKVNNVFAVYAAAIICPIVNTSVFLLGCWLFFLDTVSGWAAAFGFPNAAEYMFISLAGNNFLLELSANIVLAPAIIFLIKIGKSMIGSKK